MKGCVATGFGLPADVLSVSDELPKPSLSPLTHKDRVLIRVLAVSLSPSDWRTLSGEARLAKKPKAWPFIPGGDVSGVVEEVLPGETKFAVGDKVVGTWSPLFGEGGLAEHYLLDTKLTVKMPQGLTPVEAAAMANSPFNALKVVETAAIKGGERVLVLGGGGGVGTTVVQLLRNRGATYVAATSTDAPLLKSLGVDRVVDYRSEAWDAVPEWEAEPFDVIIDCAEGVSGWRRACSSKVVKPGRRGGRFVAVVLNEWDIKMTKVTDVFKWALPLLARVTLNMFTRRWRPKYKVRVGGPVENAEDLGRGLELAASGTVRPVVDSRSPHPLTTEGVRDAFELLRRRAGHGKIVIRVASE